MTSYSLVVNATALIFVAIDPRFEEPKQVSFPWNSEQYTIPDLQSLKAAGDFAKLLRLRWTDLNIEWAGVFCFSLKSESTYTPADIAEFIFRQYKK